MEKLDLFQQSELRRIYDEKTKAWYFSVVDTLGLLTQSADPKSDWRQLRRQDRALGAVTRGFRLKDSTGKNRIEDCANIDGILRIVQSCDGNAERVASFKRWIAHNAKQRLDEVQNPQILIDKARETYRKKGYPEDWIDVRLKSIIVREELTDEWAMRGVTAGREYAILTSIISREAFGMTTAQHKELKGLKNQSLRDHMTQVELVLTMLGEVTTTEIVRVEDVQGFESNKGAAKRGGRVAGNARKQIEKEAGKPIATSENFLPNQPPSNTPTELDDIPF